ncbi:hypothetical protein EDC04DRAFT_2608482 [Pisolithus marmoratus]|nr:hypothetical protein EDC04DRAFT_2608482 [Pisolithus marmoratus]
MSAAFNAMDNELQWTFLCLSLGIEGFYVVVHGGIEDPSTPKLYFSEKGEKFFCLVLDLEPCHLALKFEAFIISDLAERIDSTLQHWPHTLNKLISECRMAIQKGLDEVLHDNRITRTGQMNYDNYEHKIVEWLGMKLVGWPTNLLPICNPGHVGAWNQKKLSKDKLQRRTALNKEHHARGEHVYKPCNKHTVQGTEKNTTTANSNIKNDGSDLDGNDSDNAYEIQLQHVLKFWVHSTKTSTADGAQIMDLKGTGDRTYIHGSLIVGSKLALHHHLLKLPSSLLESQSSSTWNEGSMPTSMAASVSKFEACHSGGLPENKISLGEHEGHMLGQEVNLLFSI